MVCEKILGNLSDPAFEGVDHEQVDYVDIEWHEAFKKLHKKKTGSGREIGIRLGNEILTRGMRPGDVIYQDDEGVIAVRIPDCDCIIIEVDPYHLHQASKVCYEIGNKHAALFYGRHEREFITPYNAPTFEMLQKMHGVTVSRGNISLDFDRSIASAIHNHTH